jgi:regulatory protein RepA
LDFPPIHDVSVLVHQPLPQPEFHIQNLLTKDGRMLIYGGAGVRKSWLVQHLAFSIATGSDWLGFRTAQDRVLLVNFEISPVPFASLRLRPMEARFALQPQMLYEWSPGIMRLDDRPTFNTFAAFVRNIAPKVIILDCLQACYGGDENDMEQSSVWIDNVEELRREFGCSIVIVHHENKSILATGMGRIRGTSRFPGWVDSTIHMVEQPTGIQLQFEKYRNSIVEHIGNMNVVFHEYLWSVR